MEKLLPSQRRALGAALRHRRLGLGWTQQELATHVHLARAYISHIESGSKAPSMPVLTRFCRAMAISPIDIMIESGLSQPRDSGIHPQLLESLRRLEPDAQLKLAKIWPDLERFITSCMAVNSDGQNG